MAAFAEASAGLESLAALEEGPMGLKALAALEEERVDLEALILHAVLEIKIKKIYNYSLLASIIKTWTGIT